MNYRRGLSVLMLVVCIFLSACERKANTTTTRPDSIVSDPDIVVIGSEIEGMYLARAAKDEGLNVKILDPRELTGGQLIQGQMQYLDEPTDDDNHSLLQGRVKELFDKYKKGEIRKNIEFEQYYNTLIDGIPLESGITVVGIEKVEDSGDSKQKIESLKYLDKYGVESTVHAKYWVENTDFASLSSKLGLNRIAGIENVFGGSKNYMSASLMMKFRNVDWAIFKKEINRLSKKEREGTYGSMTTVTDNFTWGFGNVGARYQASDKNVFLRGLNSVNQKDGEVLINALLIFDVNPSDKDSIDNAINRGEFETQRILPHLRKELPGWENAEINGFPNYLYIRDYDRYETEYVLQASDLMSGRMFWDNVSIAGYPIDLQGTRDHTWGQHSGDPDKYGMPLRSFIAKGYSNVIFAGKNVGASAIAYGSARIQPNTSLAAEVIGILLGKLKGEGKLSDLTEKELASLQDEIKKNYGITLSRKTANNKIKNFSEEQQRQLNEGKLTLP